MTVVGFRRWCAVAIIVAVLATLLTGCDGSKLKDSPDYLAWVEANPDLAINNVVPFVGANFPTKRGTLVVYRGRYVDRAGNFYDSGGKKTGYKGG